ncbi:response regulator transcription factor [Wenxinia saemankumensis]|uniref:Two component transcriptional regulator, LuxR family n=1 Tax=Wenxinia saemankumensis TaxID=1447782 RepID=A0A1M6AAY0_9RHOB|nr:response regulator transcription factor [Wenxinia saemankumensis]SHI33587.1 two component transcriptional regulator, LuxR family [Wenxinia saemankumensis]
MPDPARFARALIVDDHPLFCDALALTLKSVAGLGASESAPTLGAALARIEGPGPALDLIVLDLDLPDVTGLEGLARMRGAAPLVPLIVVSSMTEPQLVAAAIRAGARGFVPKHSPRETFRAALAAIAAGGRWVPEGVDIDDAAPGAQEEAMGRMASLTRQQARILELICEGKLNKQIAFDLDIAEATVKAHVTSILRKLGVQSRTQAVLLARQVSFDAFAAG